MAIEERADFYIAYKQESPLRPGDMDDLLRRVRRVTERDADGRQLYETEHLHIYLDDLLLAYIGSDEITDRIVGLSLWYA